MGAVKRTTLLRSGVLVALIGIILVSMSDGVLMAKSIAAASADLALVGLHDMANNGSDGTTPSNSIIAGGDGVVYGTTLGDGNGGKGTFYKLTATGDRYNPTVNYTVLHHFGDGSVSNDGENCMGKLAKDGSGYIYGACPYAGIYGHGVVYRINTSNGAVTILHQFGSVSNDGRYPLSGVVIDGSGNLYGATHHGGGSGCSGVGGCGTIWKLAPSGGGYTYSKVYNFTGGSNDGEGVHTITLASDGNLYGTTVGGGANGVGLIFRYIFGGGISKIASNPVDGWQEYQALVEIPSSFTGGLMEFWGTTNLCCSTYGVGSIYKITETSTGSGVFNYTTVHEFNPSTYSGAGIYAPLDGLVFSSDLNDGDSGGVLYGVTIAGGPTDWAGFFRITLDGTIFTDFLNDPGKWSGDDPFEQPWGLVQGSISGTPVLFGGSPLGGANNKGWLWHVMDI